jgi:glycosyltransferase involved in cell wall biosynthesis
MYLLADAQALQTPASRHRGVGRYAANLLRALAAARPDWRIEAVVNTRLVEPDAAALGKTIAVRPFEPLLEPGPGTRDANDQYFGDWLRAAAPDAVLELSFFEEAAVVPLFVGAHPPLVGVAYDLIPIVFHEHYLARHRDREWYGARFREFAQCDRVLAISEATRGDVLRVMRWPPARVVSILGAAEPHPFIAGPDAADRVARTLAGLGIDRPFVLYVGGNDRRKNLRGALAAFAAMPPALRDAHAIVVVCDMPAREAAALRRAAADLGVAPHLRLTGFVSEDVLQTLYRACRLSLFPSYYEGLGLPVIEALQCGAPVVASDRSGIPEFAGPVSRLVDPASPAAMAAAMTATRGERPEEGAEARRRFAAGFTWPRTAARAASVIEGVLPRPSPPRRVRPRVAWVSPLPPTRSGIADYSAELLDRLPDEFEIDLIVSPEATTDPALSRRFGVRRPGEAIARHADVPYDLFVYQMGNSDLHTYMLPLMARHAGLTVLHEVYLGGLALRASRVGRWGGDVADDLEREGHTDLAAAVRDGSADHGRIVTDATLSRRIVEASDGVIVHSQWSWNQVRGSSGVPLSRIPQGTPRRVVEPRVRLRAALGLPSDRFLVVSIGEVTPAKRLGQVIEAAGALPERIGSRLDIVIVGAVDAPAASRLRASAREAAVAIRFEGRVPLDRLGDYARAADACVQLRYPTRGETSAALLRALAAGAVCIVSDAGSFAEIPADAALHVRTPDHERDDLVSALLRLHDDPALGDRIANRARRFVEDQHDLDTAARQYVAAMQLTMARRRRDDGEWRDAASIALAAARDAGRLPADAIDRWARLRTRATA